MIDAVCRMDLCEVANAITRELSSREVTKACLARAERLQPILNTFISLDAEGALAAAERADAALARGDVVGPLHGVPVAHKDMFYREKRVVTCGSRLRQNFVPDYTATVLARLDVAGAIELGGLNMWSLPPIRSGSTSLWGALEIHGTRIASLVVLRADPPPPSRREWSSAHSAPIPAVR